MDIKLTPIYQKLKNDIKSLQKINTSAGSVADDLFLKPLSYIHERLNILQEFYKRSQSPVLLKLLLTDVDFKDKFIDLTGYSESEYAALLSEAIVNLGNNFNLKKFDSIPASGTVYLLFDTDKSVTIPKTLTVSSKTTNIRYTYSSESEMTITPAYNSDLASYTIPLFVVAETSGAISNAETNTIDSVAGQTIPGLVGVTNPEPFTNGMDEESDSDFLDRILLGLTSKNIYSRTGLEMFIRTNPAIKDIYIVTPRDPLYRTTIDCWTITELLQSKTETLYPINTIQNLGGYNQYTIMLSSGPIDRESVRIWDSSPSPISIPYNDTISNYYYDFGTNISFEYSAKERYIINIWDKSNSLILPFKVSYNYDINIEKIQGLIDEEMLFGYNILVKKAIKDYLSVEFSVVLYPGAIKTVLEPKIKAAIVSFANSLILGQPIGTSDLINVIENVSGVDKVTNFAWYKGSKSQNPNVQPMSINEIYTPLNNSHVVIKNEDITIR